MREKHWSLVTVVAFAVSLIAAPGARCAEVMQLVPEDAVVVISTPGINELDNAVVLFADTVSPGSSAGILEMLGELYTFETGKSDGLDMDASAALFLMLSDKPAAEQGEAAAAEDGVEGFAGESVAEEEMSPLEGLDFNWVVVLPLADEAAWRAAMGESIVKAEGTKFETIEGPFGPESSFVIRDGHIVAAEGEAQLDRYSELAAEPLSGGRARKLADALDRAPLCMQVSLDALLRRGPELLDFIDSAAAELGEDAAPQKQLLMLYAKIALDVANDVDTLLVEVDPSASALRLSLNVDALEGSLFGDIFAAQAPADLSVLEEIPQGSFAFGTMRLDAEPLVDYMMELNAKLVDAVAGDAEPGEEQALLDQYDSILKDSLRYGLLESPSFALRQAPGSAGLEVLATYGTNAPSEALEMLPQAMQSIYANPVGMKVGAVSGLAPQAPEISEETIAGQPVTVIQQRLGGEDVDPDALKAVELLYGNPMITRLAASDGRLLLTLGGDGQLMQAMLEGSQARVSADLIARSLSSLSAEPSCVVLASVPDLMMFGMGVAMAVQGNALQMPPLQRPPASRLVAGAASFDGPTARLELNIPVEQINAAKVAAMQAMMMQMQQNMQGMEGMEDMPAPSEGVAEEAPWEAEGE